VSIRPCYRLRSKQWTTIGPTLMATLSGKTRRASSQRRREVSSGKTKGRLLTRNRRTIRTQGLANIQSTRRETRSRTKSFKRRLSKLHSTAVMSETSTRRSRRPTQDPEPISTSTTHTILRSKACPICRTKIDPSRKSKVSELAPSAATRTDSLTPG